MSANNILVRKWTVLLIVTALLLSSKTFGMLFDVVTV